MTDTDAAASPEGRGRKIARGIGWGLVALALAAFGYEVLMAVQTGGYRVIAAGELWYGLHRASLNLVQAVVQRHLHPFLWDPLIQTALTWPAWALFGVPGVALLAAFRRRRSAGAR